MEKTNSVMVSYKKFKRNKGESKVNKVTLLEHANGRIANGTWQRFTDSEGYGCKGIVIGT